MAFEKSRSTRVAEQIKRELARLIQMEVKDPRISWVTISAIDLSPDYSNAKVFFTTLDSQADRQSVEAALNSASGFLRNQLGKCLSMRTLPRLSFHFDESIEEGMRLHRLIEETAEKEGLDKKDSED